MCANIEVNIEQRLLDPVYSSAIHYMVQGEELKMNGSHVW